MHNSVCGGLQSHRDRRCAVAFSPHDFPYFHKLAQSRYRGLIVSLDNSHPSNEVLITKRPEPRDLRSETFQKATSFSLPTFQCVKRIVPAITLPSSLRSPSSSFLI